MIEGSGSGSIPLTSGSGYGRPKHVDTVDPDPEQLILHTSVSVICVYIALPSIGRLSCDTHANILIKNFCLSLSSGSCLFFENCILLNIAHTTPDLYPNSLSFGRRDTENRRGYRVHNTQTNLTEGNNSLPVVLSQKPSSSMLHFRMQSSN